MCKKYIKRYTIKTFIYKDKVVEICSYQLKRKTIIYASVNTEFNKKLYYLISVNNVREAIRKARKKIDSY